jgi:hypothetical protein
LVGSGFLLALFFLRHPKHQSVNDESATPRGPTQAVQSQNTSDLTKVVEGAKSPRVTIKITQSEAADPKAKSGVMTVQAFKQLADDALKSLPKQEPKKDLTEEEAHHITIKTLKETESLGDIAQAVADNPQLKKPAFDFYYQCASDEQNNLAWTVRSRCLSKLRVLSPQLGKEEQRQANAVVNSVNPSIKEWSDFIPN